MIKKGKFIVFEGLDGSGQSTQIALLEKYLKNQNRKVHITAEPTNNLIGGLIRSALRKQWKISNTGLQLLYSADRAHHLETEIQPLLKKGYLVISSRYFFSSLAFGSLNNDLKWLKSINENFPQPDLTIFLKVSPQECIRRINASRARKELFEEKKKLEKVLKIYMKISKMRKEYENFIVIDGNQSIKKVHQIIIQTLKKKNF